MTRILTLVFALVATQASAGTFAIFSDNFVATSPEEAVTMASDFVASDAWQLIGSNGAGSILHSEQFPITTWGRGYTDGIPADAWEDRGGVMQELRRAVDWPDDWFGLAPNLYGQFFTLKHWHILDSPTLGKFTSLDVNYVFNRENTTKFRINDDGNYFLYRSDYDEPGRYSVMYKSNIDQVVPEATSLQLLGACLLIGVAMARTRKRSEFMDTIDEIEQTIRSATFDNIDDVDAIRNDAVEKIQELISELQEKFDNLPEGFQVGPNGQRIEERISACEEWSDSLENMELTWEEMRPAIEEDMERPVGEAFDAYFNERREEMLESVPSE